MTRIALALALLLSFIALPVSASGQANGPTRIGFLPLGSPFSAYDRALVETFRQGLREIGLLENGHVSMSCLPAG